MSQTPDNQNPAEGELTRPEDQVQDSRTAVQLTYSGASQLVTDERGATVQLLGDRHRPPVALRGRMREPLLIREALSCLYEIVAADFRYVPKDRTAYLAYSRMRKSAQGMSAWDAQRAYFEWMARNDPTAFLVLDPVVSVHPDAVLFEVFSKDEGAYAALAIDRSALELEGEPTCGTTNIDYSRALFDGVQRLRSYRDSALSIGAEAVAVATAGQPEAVEKSIQLPDSWLRGFLQVQSAATLPATRVEIAAIDLYNVLRQLRLNADQKRAGRGVRVELVPGERPRLVLEPWELVLETGAAPYSGRTPAMVRIWGRRRLSLLRRLLPFVDKVELHLLGSGLPSFYVLRAGPVRLTLGLSGFTAANWAQAVAFDLLLPRLAGPAAHKLLASALTHLEGRWAATATELAAALKKPLPEVLAALQLGCQQGQLMFDLAAGVYRLRPLLAQPVELGRLEFRNLRERIAHDLIAAKAAKIVSEARTYGVGLGLTGEVKVAAERREYRPRLVIDDEGRVREAECTCAFFRKHKLKEGPCAHLIALRVLHGLEEQRRREERGAGRGAVLLETRTYARRQAAREEVVQLSLDRQRLRVRWGQRGQAMRVQSLVFSSVADARAAYFARVDELEARGYMDEAAV